MPTKKLLILSGVFLALLAFVILFERKQPTSEERAKSAKRLADVNVEDVASVLLERPDLPKVELCPPREEPLGARGRARGPGGRVRGREPRGRPRAARRRRRGAHRRRPEGVRPRHAEGEGHRHVQGQVREDVLVRAGDSGNGRHRGLRRSALRGRPGGAARGPDEAAGRLPKPFGLRDADRRDHARHRHEGADTPSSSRADRSRTAPRAAGGWRSPSRISPRTRSSTACSATSRASGSPSSRPSLRPSSQRVGLSPSWATVRLEKGAEIVATISFGAAKADAGGKLYAKVGNVVAVVDDRVREDLDAEMSAWREGRVLPVDLPALRRVSFAADELRAGAEKVEGSWRSTGREIPAEVAEALGGGIARAEVKSFLPRRSGKSAKDKPVATLELLSEGETTERVVSFFEAPPGAAGAAGGGHGQARADARRQGRPRRPAPRGGRPARRGERQAEGTRQGEGERESRTAPGPGAADDRSRPRRRSSAQPLLRRLRRRPGRLPGRVGVAPDAHRARAVVRGPLELRRGARGARPPCRARSARSSSSPSRGASSPPGRASGEAGP